ncbi:MAG TPA: DUF4111 domain-containing protein, partial [Opitutaceae bacterium]|nr:DUF4111 domain-containing protein [Opitutaceae bacterium]
PYPGVNRVLHELVARAGRVLGKNLVGVYLHGSLAVGDFDERDSDLDFLVVVGEPLAEAEVAGLQAMHDRLHDFEAPWAQHLEGSYLPKALLEQPEAVGVTPLWYLDNGWRELTQSVHDNSWVVFWILHRYGITVAGPEAKTLFGPVPADRLRREVLAVMKNWGGDMRKDPAMISSVWYQSFAVISFCRMLQTLRTGEIHSKKTGVHWAQAELEPRWAGLIQRAWKERPDPSRKIRLPPAAGEVEQTLEFIGYAQTLALRSGYG